jgi:sirohydrochlorin cobaltochelatase
VVVNGDSQIALANLDGRLRTMLPEEYQDCYDDVQPVSMGSAGLKYDQHGRVAWNEMWATFCDLAMAGGPPHKGTLLTPAPPAAIEAEPERYEEVLGEICRGIWMVTDLDPEITTHLGWISVPCPTETAADWLHRAIVMENVSARREERYLELPAGPAFRLDKEIKNVVTVIAKAYHYWDGHMSPDQHQAIAHLFATMAASAPLVTAGTPNDPAAEDACRAAAAGMASRIQSSLGLRRSETDQVGWLGVECPNIRAAVWLMRALVVSNVLARREGTALCVPIDPSQDPGGERVLSALAHVHGLAKVRGVL